MRKVIWRNEEEGKKELENGNQKRNGVNRERENEQRMEGSR